MLCSALSSLAADCLGAMTPFVRLVQAVAVIVTPALRVVPLRCDDEWAVPCLPFGQRRSHAEHSFRRFPREDVDQSVGRVVEVGLTYGRGRWALSCGT